MHHPNMRISDKLLVVTTCAMQAAALALSEGRILSIPSDVITALWISFVPPQTNDLTSFVLLRPMNSQA
jgi:hypothetical protein